MPSGLSIGEIQLRLDGTRHERLDDDRPGDQDDEGVDERRQPVGMAPVREADEEECARDEEGQRRQRLRPDRRDRADRRQIARLPIQPHRERPEPDGADDHEPDAERDPGHGLPGPAVDEQRPDAR